MRELCVLYRFDVLRCAFFILIHGRTFKAICMSSEFLKNVIFKFFAMKMLPAASFLSLFFWKNFYRFVTDVDTEWSKPARYEGEPWNQILGFLVSSRRSVSSPHWSHVDLLPHVTSISNAKLHERTDVSSKAELLFVFNPFLIFLPHELSSHFRFFFMKLDLFCVRTQTITEDLLFSVCFFLIDLFF